MSRTGPRCTPQYTLFPSVCLYLYYTLCVYVLQPKARCFWICVSVSSLQSVLVGFSFIRTAWGVHVSRRSVLNKWWADLFPGSDIPRVYIPARRPSAFTGSTKTSKQYWALGDLQTIETLYLFVGELGSGDLNMSASTRDHVHYQTKVRFLCFFCSPSLHLFDPKYNKNSTILKYFYHLK